MFRGKHILIGITGSIAAYKVALLARLLVKQGAEVKIVMTQMAKQFITPLTMATLTKNPICVDFYNPENGDWNSHVSLGLWSDLYLIAPASANTIAKMATGVADNLLLTTYLSAKCPVAIAPAMDLDMYKHPATQANLEMLRNRGDYIITPGVGELASGLEGEGRMEEPEIILTHLSRILNRDEFFSPKRVLITGGPTREKIDPVRFISNYSTGKMALSLVQALYERGACIDFVSGETKDSILLPDINVERVESAAQMYDKTISLYKEFNHDIVILCAAVADFTPVSISDKKVKRGKENYSIELKPTKDIAAEIGSLKRDGSTLIGFALETDSEVENAKGKLSRKGLDLIVLNSLKNEGAGFASDTNIISIINKSGEITNYPLKSKQEVAGDILDYIKKMD